MNAIRREAAPLVSVVMPTWGHAHFIARAIESLLGQTLAQWELVIVDDASPDDTAKAVAPYVSDPRIRYVRLPSNRGLGAALNIGVSQTSGERIAYLPSDDLYFAGHLRSLFGCLDANPQAVLAFSGVRHHYNREAIGLIEGYSMQLVQVMHLRTPARWMEREELVTDDLARMMWTRLNEAGVFSGTGRISCEWVDHPQQLHKVLREPLGGINPFRQRFDVAHPLRFHTTVGNPIDEARQYTALRRPTPARPARDGLKILLVGELAYNADRILALEERGHRLYGLWMREPYWYNTVGPLPFGHVEDLPHANWREAVHKLQPDVIYALLNWQAVPFAHQVLGANLGIPFVWHFKEGPFICLEKGTWRELMALHHDSDGCIYSSPEMREWFHTLMPGLDRPTLVLDGDLPKRDWLRGTRSPLLSRREGEIHTVVPGRPIGLHPHTVAEMKAQGIHLHFYGNFTHGQWAEWIAKTRRVASGYLHLHAQVDHDRWVEEFSRYDAGWLHFFRSDNHGELRRANWDDLNYPARLATLAAAGLPVLQRDNPGSIVATQSLVRSLDIGLFFSDMAQLREQLADAAAMSALRERVWAKRELFTFDHHADRLIGFFREIIAARKATRASAALTHAWPVTAP